MVAYKYIVESGIDTSLYNEFDTADEAIAYAKEHGDAATFVKKIEVEMNDFGEVTQEYGQEIIWQPDNTLSPEDEDAWIAQRAQEEEDKKYVDPFEADEFGDFYTNRHDNESLNVDAMVEDLENNESEVECKHCFDLFPKEECVKTEHGYLCKECAKVHESLEDTVEQDLNDDRTPIQDAEEILAEPFNASEMRKHEHAIKEEFGYESLFDYTGEVMEEVENNSDLYEFWWENNDDLNEDAPGVHEVNYVDYKHSYCHILQPNLKKLNALVNYYKAPVDNIKGFIFNLLKDPQVRWTEKEKEFAKNVQSKDDPRDIYTYVVNSINKAKDIIVKVNENGELVGSYRTEECLPEELEEYFNYPAIEIDDIELDGMDNAVVDCQTDFKVIAHSEDEKPLDCKMKKEPLEKPLTEENEPEITQEMYDAQCEKMQQLENGTRNYNIKAVSNAKLKLNYKICKEKGFTKALKIMEDEMKARNLSLTEDFNTEHKRLLDRGLVEVHFDDPTNLDQAIANKMTAILTDDAGKPHFYAKPEFAAHIEKFYKARKTENLTEDDVENFFKNLDSLEEAKKEDELPPDPEAAKLEVHTMLNNLVADEIEAINGYEEAKAEIMDAPIAHKDVILDTVDHVEDEEKEHVDELIDATTEIPFDKTEAPKEEDVPAPEGVTFDLSDGSGEPEEVTIKDGEVIEEPKVKEDLNEATMSWEEKVEKADSLLDELCDKLAVPADDGDGYWVTEYDTWCMRNLYHFGSFDQEDHDILAQLVPEYNNKLPNCEFYFSEDDDLGVCEVGYMLDKADEDYNTDDDDSLENEDPFDQDFPETETESVKPTETNESYPDIPFDSEVKEGDKIRIIHLSGENSDYDGKEGVVEHIDGIGQLHGTWGGLAIIPGVDEFEIID